MLLIRRAEALWILRGLRFGKFLRCCGRIISRFVSGGSQAAAQRVVPGNSGTVAGRKARSVRIPSAGRVVGTTDPESAATALREKPARTPAKPPAKVAAPEAESIRHHH